MFKKIVCVTALLVALCASAVFGADISSVQSALPTDTDAMVIENTSTAMEVDVAKKFKAGATLCFYSYIESTNSLELVSDNIIVDVNGKVKLQTKGAFSVLSENPITVNLTTPNIPTSKVDTTTTAKTGDDFFNQLAIGGGAIILGVGALIVIKQAN